MTIRQKETETRRHNNIKTQGHKETMTKLREKDTKTQGHKDTNF